MWAAHQFAYLNLFFQALNELAEKQNWPLEFVDGYLEELFVSIPWASLLKDSSFIEVRGLKLTLQPKQRSEHGEFNLCREFINESVFIIFCNF